MTLVLRRTVGSWSAGTRVEIIEESGDIAAIEIQAGDRPAINGVPLTDLVERRQRAGTITRGVGGGTEGTTAEDTEVQDS